MCLRDAQVNIKNLTEIQQNINKHSPFPEKVKIIAVTKTFSAKTILNALDNNLVIIGENKVQETLKKIKKIKHKKFEKHLIGHLQSNKTKSAVKIYDIIQTADSEKIINKINRFSEQINKKQKILIQINITDNKKQYGIKKEGVVGFIEKIKQLKNIELIGLMAIGPNTTNKKTTNQYYKKIKLLQNKVLKINKEARELSIGMSGDYIEALKHGATMIRLGTILFGTRK